MQIDFREWDSREWKAKLYSAMHPTNKFHIQQLRQEVFFNTMRCVKQGGYRTESGVEIVLDLHQQDFKDTLFYKKELPAAEVNTRFDTQVDIVCQSPLTCAKELVILYGSEAVSVLNVANRRNPGGGVLEGANNKEATLFRCSGYYRSMYQFVDYGLIHDVPRAQFSYPLNMNFGGVFTPKMLVFRDSESTGYKLLETPWQINFIAVPGVGKPEVTLENGNYRMSDNVVLTLTNRVRTIFRIAMHNRQEVLVLSSLCGDVFHNPVKHMAEIFKSVMQEDEFVGAFRKICFSVKGNPGGFAYNAFNEVFAN